MINSSGCDGILLANDGQGGLLRLRPPVIAVIERGGAPPLIVTCQDWRYALIDANTWTTIPLPLKAGHEALQFLLSPDGRQLAFASLPRVPINSMQLEEHVVLADTRTGQLRTLIDSEQLSANKQLGYSGYDLIRPVAWSGTTLYTQVEHSVTSSFWRTDTAQQSPMPELTGATVESGWWSMPGTGDWMLSGPYEATPRITNLRTGAAYTLDGGRRWTAEISPDGTRLAFIRNGSGSACCELVLYDLTHAAPAPLLSPLTIGEPLIVGSEPAIRWSPDSRRLLALTGQPETGTASALALGRDGAMLGQIALPVSKQLLEQPRPVRDDEVALVQVDEPRTIFKSVALGAANTRSLPDVTLMDRAPYSLGWILAYVPTS